MEPDATNAAKLTRGLGFTAIFILFVIILGIALISAGVFDPKPIGELRQTIEPGILTVPAGEETVKVLEGIYAADSRSIRLTAALREGELDSGYGLVLGPKEQLVGIGVSPIGYLTVWHNLGGTDKPNEVDRIIPWRTWPHVKLGNEENEIWIDIEERSLKTIRINRELLWQGDVPVHTGLVSLWAESFGQSTIVDYPKLEIFAP